MKYTHFLSALALSAIAAPAFSQGTWTFAPGPSSQAYGTPHTFTDTAGVGIIASGWDVQSGHSEVDGQTSWNPGVSTAHGLEGKFTSGDPTETGLGLANVNGNDTDFEIRKNNYIQFDLTSAISHYGKNFGIAFASLQTGEGYSLFGSATASSPFTLISEGGLGTGTTGLNLNTGSYNFIEVSAYGSAAADTLVLNTFRRTPAGTPEPFTIGLGITGVCLAVRRRMKVKV